MNPFPTLKNLSPLHFTFFFHLSYQPFTSLYFANHANHIWNSLPFTSLPLTGFHFSNPRFENMLFTVGSLYHLFR